MNPLLPLAPLDESAPETLRSPPSSLRVRDRALLVEMTDVAEEEEEPATCRYARVA